MIEDKKEFNFDHEVELNRNIYSTSRIHHNGAVVKYEKER